MRKFFLSRYTSAAFISLVVFAIIIGLRQMQKLEYLELAGYDWLVRLKPKISEINPHIVIIGVSEEDIRKYGWPLSDGKLAEALTILSRYNPRAIGVDIFRDIKVPPGSDLLDAAWRNHPNIIGVMLGFGKKDGVPPPFPLRNPDDDGLKEGQVGFNDILVDPGGTVRRGLLFIDDGEKAYYSFSLRLALHYLQKEGIVPQPDPFNPEFIRIGQTTIKPLTQHDGGYVRADAKGYQFLIDFHEDSQSFEAFSLSSLYAGEAGLEKIRDKVVLIGVIAQSVKDIFYTPLSRSKHPQQQVPGVVLHAHMVSQLLRYGHDEGFPIKSLQQAQEILWILLWCVIGSAAGLFVRSPWYLSMTALAMLLGLILIAHFAFIKGLWIPLVPPTIGYFLSASLVTALISSREKKQRTLLMSLFSRQVSPEIAKVIWHNREEFSDGSRPCPQELDVTVLFLNFEKLNTVSDNTNPAYLVEWINAYIESSLKIISKFGGTVDNCASDGIKANFGFPIPRKTETEIKEDALNALDCALAIEKEVKGLNPVWDKHGYPEVFVRIGIASGKIFAAALGHKERLKYTTVGGPADLAAKLVNFDKEIIKERVCRILISENTIFYANGQFKVRKLAVDSLGETEQEVPIYQVLGRKSNLNLKPPGR
jgi:adenylate cyclase